jgi:XRE family transcriptional regulator, regulator of sulfur utilization
MPPMGPIVRKLRQARGMTQGQLATTTGLSREYIVRLEGGRYDPSLSVIQKLAKALKVKPRDLL